MKKRDTITALHAELGRWQQAYSSVSRDTVKFANDRDRTRVLLEAAVERIDEKDEALRQMGAVIEGLREDLDRTYPSLKKARLDLSGLTASLENAVKKYGYQPTVAEALTDFGTVVEQSTREGCCS